jgi:(2Fe-2S) ferredoxin
MVVAGNTQLWERLPAAISPFMSCIQSRLEAAPTRQFRQTLFTDELFYQNTYGINRKEMIMVDEQKSPFDSHVFVCTNDRGGRAKSCADGNSQQTRARLKAEINKRDLKGRVRVSQCGCMGLCDKGPNVMIYPQKSWFPAATSEDAKDIIDRLETMLG